MKKFIILSFLAFAVGCDIDNNNHGYGFTPDLITQIGIKIIYYESAYKESPEKIDDVFLQVAHCTGLYAQPPFIVIVDSQEDINYPTDKKINGVFMTNPSLIVLIDDHIKIGNYTTLKHEIIHYLLYSNGFSADYNRDHSNLFFLTCLYN